jgi:hypothetical protein
MLRGGTKNKIFKNILLCIFLCSFFMLLTVPIHEAAHWVMSEIDPYSKPVELHVFDFFNNKENLLFFNLGYVKIKESYPDSFKDRPAWIDPVQEFICFSIQILITYFIVVKIIITFSKNYKLYNNYNNIEKLGSY